MISSRKDSWIGEIIFIQGKKVDMGYLNKNKTSQLPPSEVLPNIFPYPGEKWDGFSLDERVEYYKGKWVDWNNDWRMICNELVDQYAMDRRGIPYPPSNSSYYYMWPFGQKYWFKTIYLNSVEDVKQLKPWDILQADPPAFWKSWHIGICVEVIINFMGSNLCGIRSF